MSKLFFKYALFTFLTLSIIACNNNDDTNAIPLKDYSEQYLIDIDLIEDYMKTHSVSFDANFNPTFTKITDPNTEISIFNHPKLTFKLVENTDDDGETFFYKLYYIKLREGTGNKPSRMDSVYTSYVGSRIFEDKEEVVPATNPVTYNYFTNIVQFENIEQPVWINLDNINIIQPVIQGWSEVFQEFGIGTYTDNGADPISFDDYGVGVMFIPSGLAYYNNSSLTGSIPSYSNLIFSFKLFALRYKDHDRDGVLSKYEIDPDTTKSDYNRYYKYDSDGDEVANLYDIDDDGDRTLTKYEIKNPLNNLPYPFADIPTCSGGTLKKHLDPACQ